MKKVIALIIITLVFMIGCVTTQDSQSVDKAGYEPQKNKFESSNWITVSKLELFQNDNFLYFYISYNSDRSGKYSLFNPPDGNKFKKLGRIIGGEGFILQGIEKSNIEGIEGITLLLFPDDSSNNGGRTGYFINKEELKWNQIPQKPSDLKVDEVVMEEKAVISEKKIETPGIKGDKDNGVVNVIKNEGVDNSFEAGLEFRKKLITQINQINLKNDRQEEIIDLFGKPNSETYFGGGSKITFTYPDRFYVVFNADTGQIIELRVHNPGPMIADKITIGSTKEQLFEVVGQPEEVEKIYSMDLEKKPGIFYQLGTSSYYLLADLSFRFFFDADDKVSAMYFLSPYFEN